MTKITFFKHNDVFYGFKESGHAGFAESGSDIVCSALSAMTMLIVNAIEVSSDSNIDYSIDEQTTEITVLAKAALPEFEEDEKKRYAVSGLFMAYYYQLNDLLDEYYDYLSVEVVDRDYE